MRKGLGLVVLLAAGAGPAWAAETAGTVVAFRARPAVVMIGAAVGAAAKVRCGGGEAVTVQPAPNTWTGAAPSSIRKGGW